MGVPRVLAGECLLNRGDDFLVEVNMPFEFRRTGKNPTFVRSRCIPPTKTSTMYVSQKRIWV